MPGKGAEHGSWQVGTGWNNELNRKCTQSAHLAFPRAATARPALQERHTQALPNYPPRTRPSAIGRSARWPKHSAAQQREWVLSELVLHAADTGTAVGRRTQQPAPAGTHSSLHRLSRHNGLHRLACHSMLLAAQPTAVPWPLPHLAGQPQHGPRKHDCKRAGQPGREEGAQDAASRLLGAARRGVHGVEPPRQVDDGIIAAASASQDGVRSTNRAGCTCAWRGHAAFGRRADVTTDMENTRKCMAP